MISNNKERTRCQEKYNIKIDTLLRVEVRSYSFFLSFLELFKKFGVYAGYIDFFSINKNMLDVGS